MPKLFSIHLLAAFLVIAPAASADTYGSPDNYDSPDAMGSGAYKTSTSQKPESYGSVISTKLSVGAANLFLSPLEIHKNIVNTTNESNVALGVTGGVLKGGLHMCGRMIAGFVDMVSFPLPTEPLTSPRYVWEDYNVETHYLPLLKMKDTR